MVPFGALNQKSIALEPGVALRQRRICAGFQLFLREERLAQHPVPVLVEFFETGSEATVDGRNYAPEIGRHGLERGNHIMVPKRPQGAVIDRIGTKQVACGMRRNLRQSGSDGILGGTDQEDRGNIIPRGADDLGGRMHVMGDRDISCTGVQKGKY